VVNVAADDPEMNVAMATARLTLPKFWQAFDKPGKGEENFALKVKITDSHGTEYFWVGDLERKDGKLYGVIDNDPEIVRNVKLGQRIEIPEQDISDWTFMRNDKIVGNYTMRVLFREMDKDEVAKFKAILEEP
jgi:uncharacterized protein YegJ (DUF2314 family)